MSRRRRGTSIVVEEEEEEEEKYMLKEKATDGEYIYKYKHIPIHYTDDHCM